MSASPEPQKRRFPTSLKGQFRRHAPQYVAGTLTLAAFQYAMNRIDVRSKIAIDTVFGADPASAWKPAALMLLLAVGAFIARIASRWYLFNAGRDAEYELRVELLRKLQQLGAAFYRKMSVGEIMSRSTSDLQQVRMLFGFGILNMINVCFAFASALQVMLGVSVKLTLACLVNLPLVILISQALSRGMYHRMRDNQAALGRMSDRLQANLAGVRVVRSFALEERERARFEATNREYLDASLALARLRGSFGPTIGTVAALGTLVFFWYGSSLLLRGPDHGGFTPGAFFAFWSAFTRMTWPMIGARLRPERRAARPRRVRSPQGRVRCGARGRRRATPRPEARERLAVRPEPHLRLRRPQGARRRELQGRARRVACHRRPHGVGQDDARDAPRASAADAGGQRADRRHTTSASFRSGRCAPPSATRSRMPSSSPRPWLATSASRSTTPTAPAA